MASLLPNTLPLAMLMELTHRCIITFWRVFLVYWQLTTHHLRHIP
jgi:hypothetical protein